MLDPSRSLSRILKLNKQFLQFIFMFLLFLFIATFFAPFRGIYDRFIQRAEVRKSIEVMDQDIWFGDRYLIKRFVTVANKGNQDARNVNISVRLFNGEITNLEIYSDEIYSSSDEFANRLMIELPRLSAGAQVILIVNAEIFPYMLINDISQFDVVATYDGGIAEPISNPTAFETMTRLGDEFASGITIFYRRFRETVSPDVSPLVFGIESISLYPLSGREYRQLLFSFTFLSLLMYFFLPKLVFFLVFSVFSGFFVWLFIDMRVGLEGVIVTLFLLFASSSVLCVQEVFKQERKSGARVCFLCLSTFFFLVASIGILNDFENSLSNQYLLFCRQGEVFVPFALLSIFTFFDVV